MKNIHLIALGISAVILTLLISAYTSSTERICQEPPSFTRTIGIPPNVNEQAKPGTNRNVEEKPRPLTTYTTQPQEDKKEAPIQYQFTLPQRIAEWLPFHCANVPQEKAPNKKDAPEAHGSPNGYPASP